MKRTIVIIIFVCLATGCICLGQQPPQQTVSHYTTYVFLQATAAPENKRSEDTFHKIVDDMQRFLREHRVAMAADPTGRNWHSEALIPLADVLRTGKQAGAASVLYSAVTLPGKSIGVKTTAYALDGNKIWETSAGCDMGDKIPLDACLKVTVETLHEALKYRINEQDLPVLAEKP
jgi:hypothetical protein